MKKLFILAAAMLTGFSAWAALPLSPLSADTTFFTSDFWGETVSKNTVIYNQSNQFMMLTQGNPLSFANDMMYIGNSSKVSAFVFCIADATDLTLAVDQNSGSAATVTLYYLGTDTPDELSSSNVSAAGTKTCGALTLSTAGLQELTALCYQVYCQSSSYRCRPLQSQPYRHQVGRHCVGRFHCRAVGIHCGIGVRCYSGSCCIRRNG